MPTSIILPRFLLILAAWEIMSFPLADAVIMTRFVPKLLVHDPANFTTSPFLGLIEVTPNTLANGSLISSKLTQITLHLLTFSSYAVNKPIKPKPITTKVSPIVGLANLNP